LSSALVKNSLSWVIGGPQGSGVDSAANIFSRACAQGGLHLFGKREYYSNIKGEHSYFTVRVAENPVNSHLDEINILVSFDAETIFRHAHKVAKGGAIIYDSTLANISINEVPTIDDQSSIRISDILNTAGYPTTIQGILDFAKSNGCVVYGLPYFEMIEDLARGLNDPSLSKLTRMVNVIALSSSLALLKFDKKQLIKAIQTVFQTKPKVLGNNIAAAEYAYSYIGKKYDITQFNYVLEPRPPLKEYLLVQGNQASAMGKIIGGCRFQTYYPITPASDDSEFLEANQIFDLTSGAKGSIVVVQTEDEIAAITMAISAALTGVRSATATSGPGFSLMAEALGWAGMNEVPVVITLYQRTGPSTGLPTRHEQSDLLFAIHAGHGEFPRIVFASGDIEEAFYDSIKVFNLAEKYQLPVIHMLDKALANSIKTCKEFDQRKVPIERGDLINKVDENLSTKSGGHYLRFRLSDNPVSTRVPLGTENAIFWNTGDEHTEEGHITEDPDLRNKMVSKRMNKLEKALSEIPIEDKLVCFEFGKSTGDITVVSWGSTKGAIIEAMEMLAERGKAIRFIQLRLLHPFPSYEMMNLLKNTRLLIDIEMNYTSQLASLIKQHTGRDIDYRIVKFNGRPMSTSEVYYAVSAILEGTSQKRIVLEHGT
jgi:2-oxoglutarate/2-oxoacid ferredoxin oxidoreductase subunit alpha